MTCQVTVDLKTGALCGKPQCYIHSLVIDGGQHEYVIPLCWDHMRRYEDKDPLMLVFKDLSTVETEG